jgi:hypothetical protein
MRTKRRSSLIVHAAFLSRRGKTETYVEDAFAGDGIVMRPRRLDALACEFRKQTHDVKRQE